MKSILKKMVYLGFCSILMTSVVSSAQSKDKTDVNEGDTLRRAHVFHIMFTNLADANSTYSILRKTPAKNRFSEFKKLAPLKSIDPGSKNLGGDLGVIGEGQMMAEFDEELFIQPLREVSPPIRSKFGWHLIYVDAFTEEPIAQICRSSLEKIAIATPESAMDALRLSQNTEPIENLHADLLKNLGDGWGEPSISNDGDLLYSKLDFSNPKIVRLIFHTEHRNAKFDRAKYYELLRNSNQSSAFCTRSTRNTSTVDCAEGKVYYEGYAEYELRGGMGRVVRSGTVKTPQKAILEAVPKKERQLIESACGNRKIDVNYR